MRSNHSQAGLGNYMEGTKEIAREGMIMKMRSHLPWAGLGNHLEGRKKIEREKGKDEN